MLFGATSMAVNAEEPDAPSSVSAHFLPDVAGFGDGWTIARTAALEVDTDVFRDGAVAVFAGPGGARVVAAVMLVTQERVAVRRSWESAMSLYDNYSGELEYLSGRDDELDTVPPPPGCVEAKRIDGTARQLGIDLGIPMGVTLCAAEPDLTVLVVASGIVLGLSGYEASDAIASLMVATKPQPTPVP
jgi:hypothetical protein